MESAFTQEWEIVTHSDIDLKCQLENDCKANITLERGGIRNLAQTPKKNFKTHWKIWYSHPSLSHVYGEIWPNVIGSKWATCPETGAAMHNAPAVN